MHTITTVTEMQQRVRLLRGRGRHVALAITNGALHEGHEALFAAGRKAAGVLVVSIFANPLQFGASEGFAKYPRTPESDLLICERAKADAIFMPTMEEIYPRGYSTYVQEEVLAKPLCGISRPTYFRGVTTITTKLLNIVRPDFLVMGQKDAQLIAVVRKMIADLHFGVEVVVVPTARAADGLPYGVRNDQLTPLLRSEATAIHRALECARQMVASGVRSPDRIIAEATHLLGEHRRVRVIYVSIVNRATMEPMREVVPGESLLAIAAWVDEFRFTDNTEL